MNPILLPLAELKPALAGLSKVIQPKAENPVLRHVKIERTADGWIVLTGTDLDRFVTLRFEQPTDGPPTGVLIPLYLLKDLVKNTPPNEQLQIETGLQGTILIRFALAASMGATQVKPVPVAEFPATPRIEGKPVPLTSDLRRSLREALACASDDPTRAVLNGAFIDASQAKAHYIVGTDGRHLYSANSFTLPLQDSVVLPGHPFMAWREFNLDGEWQLRADKQHVQISSRRWRFVSRQTEGTYPDWRMPVPHPRDAKTHLTLDPDQLDNLIQLIQRLPSHDDRCHSIGLDWKQGGLALLAKDEPHAHWQRVPVSDVTGTGMEQTVYLNRKLLLKALQFGLNSIDLADALSPLRFHHQGRQMIVMPVRAQGSPAASAPAPPRQTPQTTRPPMIANPTPEDSSSDPTKSSLEEAIDLTLQLRDQLNDAFTQLRDLSQKLKLIHREQKANTREFNTVRSTLRSLQSLKL